MTTQAGGNVQPVDLASRCPELQDADIVRARWQPGNAGLMVESDHALFYVAARAGACQKISLPGLDIKGYAWAPDGTRVSVCWNDLSGNFGLSLFNPTNGQEQTLYTWSLLGFSGSGIACYVNWSPDGRYVAFDRYDYSGSRVALYRPETGDLYSLTPIDEQARSPKAAAFSRDGRIAFVDASPGYTYDYIGFFDGFFDGTTQVRWITLSNRFQSITRVRWSPDSNSIIFDGESSGRHDVWIVNIDGTDLHRVVDEPWEKYAPDWAW